MKEFNFLLKYARNIIIQTGFVFPSTCFVDTEKPGYLREIAGK